MDEWKQRPAKGKEQGPWWWRRAGRTPASQWVWEVELILLAVLMCLQAIYANCQATVHIKMVNA